MKRASKAIHMDATDYLFSTQANKTRLLKALENADKEENLTEMKLQDYKNQLGLRPNFTLGKL
jgi:hypothetical protein